MLTLEARRTQALRQLKQAQAEALRLQGYIQALDDLAAEREDEDKDDDHDEDGGTDRGRAGDSAGLRAEPAA